MNTSHDVFYSFASNYEHISSITVFIESATTSALLCLQLYILSKVKIHHHHTGEQKVGFRFFFKFQKI